MSVFIDTSAFFAVLDSDDENHNSADEIWAQLLESDEPLHTSNYVLVETYALLQHGLGLDSVAAFTADILPILHVSWVTESMHRIAVHSLLAANRRALSLVDCVSFGTIRDINIDRVFCFDPHFGEQGFSTLPKITSPDSSTRA